MKYKKINFIMFHFIYFVIIIYDFVIFIVMMSENNTVKIKEVVNYNF